MVSQEGERENPSRPSVTWSWDSGALTWDQMEGRETKGAVLIRSREKMEEWLAGYLPVKVKRDHAKGDGSKIT